MARDDMTQIATSAAAQEPAENPANASPDLAAVTAERDALRAEVARLRQRVAEVEILADRDPLAPVLNRRAFMRELQRTSAFCARYDAAASLVFLDLDQFKAVNDTYGHAAGDAVLATVARVLLDHVRETDVVARLGGDEFAVILTQTGQLAAQNKAESLTRLIEASEVVHEGEVIRVNISAGVRHYALGTTAANWLAEADAAMFVRKAAPRT